MHFFYNKINKFMEMYSLPCLNKKKSKYCPISNSNVNTVVTDMNNSIENNVYVDSNGCENVFNFLF